MFSGIEAASVAWKPLGWKAVAFCEIDKFASAVLAHHYPSVPNLGDVEKADFDAIGPIDVAVFGSPCQSYSIAGKRLGLDDPRGNLALVGGRVVYRKRPSWFVFENVPGLLSSDSGWDFGTLLASFAGYPPGSVFEPPEGGWRNSGTVRQAKGGYGLAWRVLDAQYVRINGFGRAVPQRRRRVFVVGYLGDWRRAAAVLFERESMQRNPPPSRQAGQGPAPTIAARTRGGGGLGTDFDLDGGLIAKPLNDIDGVSHALSGVARGGGKACDPSMETYVAHTLNAKGGVGRLDYESETLVAHSLRGGGFDASEDGTGRGTPLGAVAGTLQQGGRTAGSATTQDAFSGLLVPVVPQGVALRGRDEGGAAELTGDVMTALRTGGGGGDKPHVLVPIGFSCKDSGADAYEGVSPTLRAMNFTGSHANAGGQVAVAFDETQITSRANRSNPQPGDPCHPISSQSRPPTIAFNARQDPDSGDVTHPLDTDGSSIGILSNWRVRRLLPVECERLQGFPDGFTDVPWRKKNWTPDGPRYRAIGNSMAVNCMRWIGTRIQMVEDMTR